jgi:hypothetical protein
MNRFPLFGLLAVAALAFAEQPLTTASVMEDSRFHPNEIALKEATRLSIKTASGVVTLDFPAGTLVAAQSASGGRVMIHTPLGTAEIPITSTDFVARATLRRWEILRAELLAQKRRERPDVTLPADLRDAVLDDLLALHKRGSPILQQAALRALSQPIIIDTLMPGQSAAQGDFRTVEALSLLAADGDEDAARALDRLVTEVAKNPEAGAVLVKLGAIPSDGLREKLAAALLEQTAQRQHFLALCDQWASSEDPSDVVFLARFAGARTGEGQILALSAIVRAAPNNATAGELSGGFLVDSKMASAVLYVFEKNLEPEKSGEIAGAVAKAFLAAAQNTKSTDAVLRRTLEALCRSRHPSLRAVSIEILATLGESGQTFAFELLIASISRDSPARLQALRAIGRVSPHDPQVVRVLRDVAANPNELPPERKAAWQGMGEAAAKSNQDALKFLMDALPDDETARDGLAVLLTADRAEAIKSVVEAGKNGDWPLQRAFAETIRAHRAELAEKAGQGSHAAFTVLFNFLGAYWNRSPDFSPIQDAVREVAIAAGRGEDRPFECLLSLGSDDTWQSNSNLRATVENLLEKAGNYVAAQLGAAARNGDIKARAKLNRAAQHESGLISHPAKRELNGP